MKFLSFSDFPSVKTLSIYLSVSVLALGLLIIPQRPLAAQTRTQADVGTVTWSDIGLDYYYILRGEVLDQGSVWPQVVGMGGPVTKRYPIGAYRYELYREDGYIEYGAFSLDPGELVIISSAVTQTKIRSLGGNTRVESYTGGILARMGEQVGTRIEGNSTVSVVRGSSAEISNNVSIGAASRYQVQAGDSVQSIAEHFGVDPKVLVAINPNIETRIYRELYTGEVILIPGLYAGLQPANIIATPQPTAPRPIATVIVVRTQPPAPQPTAAQQPTAVQQPTAAQQQPAANFSQGDVLCIDTTGTNPDGLMLCTTPNSRLVAGVADANGQAVVVGNSVIKVIGPVEVGDFLVASGTPGYAIANPNPSPGTVIAQALESFSGGSGMIRALVRKF